MVVNGRRDRAASVQQATRRQSMNFVAEDSREVLVFQQGHTIAQSLLMVEGRLGTLKGEDAD